MKWPFGLIDKLSLFIPYHSLRPMAQTENAFVQKPHGLQRTTLNLHESLFHVTQVPIHLMIHLIHVGKEQIPSDKIPKHVMVTDDYLEQDIEEAIQGFDFACHAYLLPNPGNAFVTPVNWKASLDEWHYVYYPLHVKAQSEIVLHKGSNELSEQEHMSFLHSLGFSRAVILDQRRPRRQLTLVQYHNSCSS